MHAHMYTHKQTQTHIQTHTHTLMHAHIHISTSCSTLPSFCNIHNPWRIDYTITSKYTHLFALWCTCTFTNCCAREKKCTESTGLQVGWEDKNVMKILCEKDMLSRASWKKREMMPFRDRTAAKSRLLARGNWKSTAQRFSSHTNLFDYVSVFTL